MGGIILWESSLGMYKKKNQPRDELLGDAAAFEPPMLLQDLVHTSDSNPNKLTG